MSQIDEAKELVKTRLKESWVPPCKSTNRSGNLSSGRPTDRDTSARAKIEATRTLQGLF
jgi:hypothetical protein